MKLTIGYFYSTLLNLYGDNGNVEIITDRAKKRNISVEIVHINPDTPLTPELTKNINFVFMGGGPDSSQKDMYQDLVQNKSAFLKEYILSGGVGLYVCGSYQLLGHYYKSADESMLPGIGIFDLYTQHFGLKKPRCIGNTVARLSQSITADPVFKSVNKLCDTIVGFENHGGRTYLSASSTPFGTIIKGHGNNSEDQSEGLHFKNSIGTYFHGPILSRNPHLADYLIAKSVQLNELQALDDSLIISAHTASKNLR